MRFSPKPIAKSNRGFAIGSIDSILLEQALQIGGMKAKNETINVALEEFIEKRAGEHVISLFNTVEYDKNYDYRKLRGKR